MFRTGFGAICALVLMAGAAAAQTATDCAANADGSYSCSTRAAPTAANQNCRGSFVVGALFGNCSFNEVQAANRAAGNQKAVGQLIADGRCDEARTTALRSGDLELAKQVSALCAAPGGR